MREQKHPVPAQEPRPVDDIGAALADELDQLGKFCGRVLEIGVLNDDDVAGRFANAETQRGALALIVRL